MHIKMIFLEPHLRMYIDINCILLNSYGITGGIKNGVLGSTALAKKARLVDLGTKGDQLGRTTTVKRGFWVMF